MVLRDPTLPLVCVLGPVGFRKPNGVFVTAPSATQASVLAVLALNGGPVSSSRLVDLVWDDHAPATAGPSLRNHVSRLRRQLVGELESDPIRSTAAGYELDRSLVDVDADIANRWLEVARGKEASAAAADEEIVDVSRWFAPVLLEGVLDGVFLDLARTRLESLRSDVIQTAVDVRLAAGQGPELVHELLEVVSVDSYNEHAVGQLMVALYRSGRAADALAQYQETRILLAEDLGIDPSPALQEIEFKILNGHPDLARVRRQEPQPSLPATLSNASGGPFFGREEELARVERAVCEPGVEFAPMALILGPAGMGKTSLVAQACRGVRDKFVRIALGWGEGDGGSYQPWRTIARALAEYPECRASANSFLKLSSESNTEPGHRTALRDAARGMLKDAAADGACLIVLEDLHEMDSESISLCRQMMRGLGGVSFMLTERTETPTSRSTRFRGRAEIIHLEGMSVGSVVELVRDTTDLDEGLSQRLAVDVHRRSGGNPLFVGALLGVASIARPSVPNTKTSFDSVPADLEAFLREQLSVLDQSVQQALEAAAVVGMRFSPADVLTIDPDIDPVHLETAQRDGLIRDFDRAEMCFSHGLLRDAIYERAPSVRRKRLHAAAADQLLEPTTPASLYAKAWHSCRGVPFTRKEDAIGLAMDAALHAEGQHAFDRASSMYRETLGLAEESDHGTRGQSLLGLTRALVAGGFRQQAIQTLLEAEREATVLNRVSFSTELSRVAALFGRDLNGDRTPTKLLIRLPTVSGEGLDALELLINKMANIFLIDGWTDDAESIAMEVEERAKGDSPDARVAVALVALARVVGSGQAHSILKAARDLRSLPATIVWPRPFIDRNALQSEIGALLLLNKLDEANALAGEMEGTETAKKLPLIGWFGRFVRAEIELARGNREAALKLAGEAMRFGQEHEVSDATPSHLGLLLTDTRLSGTAHQESEFFHAVKPTGLLAPMLLGMQGVLVLWAGDEQEAASRLAELASLLPHAPRSIVSGGTAALAGELAAGVGDPEFAEVAYQGLLPYAGLSPRFGVVGGQMGPANLILGKLCGVLGRNSEARNRLGWALAESEGGRANSWARECSAYLERLD